MIPDSPNYSTPRSRNRRDSRFQEMGDFGHSGVFRVRAKHAAEIKDDCFDVGKILVHGKSGSVSSARVSRPRRRLPFPRAACESREPRKCAGPGFQSRCA